MEFQKYFQDEMAYLRDAGDAFAREFPKLAPFLTKKGNDPDVERLLEGFAFFSAKLRQKIDDDIPEFSQGLMQLLWPQYLRPVPSATIVQFSPKNNSITERKVLPKGCQVGSVPVQGNSLRFRTCYEVDMYPLSVNFVELRNLGTSSILDIGLELNVDSGWETIGLDSLKFYIHGDSSVSTLVYLYLFQYLNKLVVVTPDGEERLSASQIRTVGMGDDEELIPYSNSALSGYRLWQEYFVLPQKFLFFEVMGLDRVARLNPGQRTFTLSFYFSRALESNLYLSTSNFLLNCTPAINLFAQDAEPIRLDNAKISYPLRASDSNLEQYDVFTIDRVEGWVQGTKQRREYLPFLSFSRYQREQECFYELTRRPSIHSDRVEVNLSFTSPAKDLSIAEKEIISLELTCTNGGLPALLREGDVSIAVDGSPEFAGFTNVIPPTPGYPPLLADNRLWLLISNMAPNYVPLANVDSLRNVISLYNTPAQYSKPLARIGELRMEALKTVSTEPLVIMRKGLPIRGLKTKVDIEGSKFGGEGEIFLFGTLLSQYLSIYVSINSFVQLQIRDLDSGEEYQWRPTTGGQNLL